MKKIAFIDVDQTLTDSYWLIDLTKELLKKDIVIKKYALKILRQFDKYHKNKYSKKNQLNSYNYTAKNTTKYFSRSLKGKNKNEVIKIAKKLLEKSIDKSFYPYTKKLIKYLKDNNYYIVLVSASPFEIIDQIKEYFGADDICALVSEVENSIYTGNVAFNPGYPQVKAECVKNYRNNYVQENPFIVAFGDSTGDELMLNEADIAIVLNPDHEMKELSKSKKYYNIETNNKTVENISKVIKRK